MQNIGIIGSTGMIGQPVTKAFVDAGFKVTLFARDIDKARKIFGSNVGLFQGDLKDVKSIGRFLELQEGLYLNLSVVPDSSEKDFQPEREGIDNIIQAAKNSSIRRIGLISSLVYRYQGQNGFNWWVFETKKRAVEKIKSCGIPYSIFYPSTFMEVFEKGGYRQGNWINLAGDSKQKMYLIAGSDYGQQVVNAFRLANGNQEYAVQGLEGFTADEAAKLYASHCEKEKVKVIKIPLGMLRFLGRFSNKYNYGANIIESLNNYPEKFESEGTWQDLGKPETEFIDFIKRV